MAFNVTGSITIADVRDGADGADGQAGTDGDRGAGWWRYATGTSASTTGLNDTTLDSYLLAAAGVTPVAGDRLIAVNTSNSATGYLRNNSNTSWTQQADFIDGDLLVAGTVTSSALNTGAVTADKIAASAVTADKVATNAITGTKLADSSVSSVKIDSHLQSDNYSAGSAGWKINKDGSAEFNGVVISRQLQVDSGTYSAGNVGGSGADDPDELTPFYIQTNINVSAWAGTNKTYLVAIGNTGTVTADTADVTNNPTTIRWGFRGDVVPLTQWSGTAKLWIKVTPTVSNVVSTNLTLQWKIYEVT